MLHFWAFLQHLWQTREHWRLAVPRMSDLVYGMWRRSHCVSQVRTVAMTGSYPSYFVKHHLYDMLPLILIIYSRLDRCNQRRNCCPWKGGEGVAHSFNCTARICRYAFFVYFVFLVFSLGWVQLPSMCTVYVVNQCSFAVDHDMWWIEVGRCMENVVIYRRYRYYWCRITSAL